MPRAVCPLMAWREEGERRDLNGEIGFFFERKEDSCSGGGGKCIAARQDNVVPSLLSLLP